MHLNCPHCHNPIDVVADAANEVVCPSCGSSFQLDPGRTNTFLPAHIPRRLGKFEFLEELGVGGYGTVYKARDTELQRTVAINGWHQVGIPLPGFQKLVGDVQHEVFGKGMFDNKCYGTCTSTAIYLTTALRAVGIPTRMMLAIPPADGSDPRQVRMIEDHIAHHQVRQTLLRGLPSARFAAHTFNEVHVGGRWRRLNYRKLGQNTYGPGAMGMLTHVLTFRDLSEAGLTKTWGRRYGRGERDDTFPGSNPYRLTEISDRFGIHSRAGEYAS